MLKVLIVDDEIIVRIGLKSCIDWGSIGFEVVDTAGNGVQAASLVDKLRPDVVFTDIKMPDMDGIQLIATIHRKYPGIKIIVLSCLDEIEYVKQAIKLGAEDYILKLSLKPDVLVKLLCKLKKDIKTEKEKETELSEASDVKRYSVRENLYRRLISTDLFPSECEELLDKLGLSQLNEHQFVECCCMIDDCVNRGMNKNRLQKFAFISMLEEIFSEYPFIDAVEISKDEYLIVIGSSRGSNILKKMELRFHNLNAALKTHFNISVSMGISSCFEDILLLPDRYREAKEAASYRFFRGKECFLPFQLLASQAIPSSVGDELCSSLLGAIHTQSKERAWKAVDEWTGKIQNIPGLSPASVRIASVETWLYLSRLLRDQNIDEQRVVEGQTQNPSAVLMNTGTLTELADYLKELVYRMIDIIVQRKKVRPEIAVLKQYISCHIEENLSLGDAARICGISRTYFSSLFKKETGENFSDYLNRMKMEKARELMLFQNIRVNEAAYRVGFNDESYFSKLFHKYMGTSPSKVGKSGEDR